MFTLNHKIAEAKATADEITSSESYKSAFERLCKCSLTNIAPILEIRLLWFVAKPVAAVAAKAVEKTSDPKEQEAEDSEARIDVTSTPDVIEEDPSAADKKIDVKRSPSKKAKRTSVFAFLGDKKKKPEDKKEVSADKKEDEDSKDETKPSETDVAPIIAEGLSINAIMINLLLIKT